MLQNPANPFEPMRCSDSIPDDILRTVPFYPTFLSPHNMFYVMVVYALLADGSFLMCSLWRGEDKEDFSEFEKQRMALFIRYLAHLVGASVLQPIQKPDSDLLTFGERYDLTESEVSILSELLAGRSLKLIALETGRTYGTVRWHVHNLLEKCQVRTQQNLLSEFYRLIKH